MIWCEDEKCLKHETHENVCDQEVAAYFTECQSGIEKVWGRLRNWRCVRRVGDYEKVDGLQSIWYWIRKIHRCNNILNLLLLQRVFKIKSSSNVDFLRKIKPILSPRREIFNILTIERFFLMKSHEYYGSNLLFLINLQPYWSFNPKSYTDTNLSWNYLWQIPANDSLSFSFAQHLFWQSDRNFWWYFRLRCSSCGLNHKQTQHFIFFTFCLPCEFVFL